MTAPNIITALRAIVAPGSTHLYVRLSRQDIVALLAVVDRQPATADEIDRITYRAMGRPVSEWERHFGGQVVRAAEAHHNINGGSHD
jgi:hypothetical protein